MKGNPAAAAGSCVDLMRLDGLKLPPSHGLADGDGQNGANAENAANAAEQTANGEMVFGRVEGLSGTERTLQDILSDEEKGPSKFEIPDFLKQ